MDNNKSIRFTTLIDTKQFDEAIRKMTNDLNYLQNRFAGRMDIQGMQAVRSLGQTVPLFRDPFFGRESASYGADKTNRQIIKEELEQRTKIVSSIKEELKELESIRKSLLSLIELKKKLNESSEEYLETTRSIAREQERLAQKEAEIIGLQSASRRAGYGRGASWSTLLGRGIESAQAAMAGGGGRLGGFGGFLGGIGGGIYDMMRYNPASFFGGLAGFAGTSLITGAQIKQDFEQAPREIVSAIGTARTAQATPALSALSGNAYQEMLNMGILERASRLAQKEVESSRFTDLMSGLGGILLGLGGGIASGGLVGNLPGAVFGGILGASGAALYNRQKILGPLGIGTYGEVYDAQKRAEEMQKRQSAYEALKASDPFYQYTIQQYQQYQLENLPVQRALGIADSDMMNYLRGANQRGFLDSQNRQAMMEIAQYGGSTQGSRLFALNANLLQRNVGMLNASQVYGNLSYMMGGDFSKTENAMKEFLASAFKMGLDKSEYRQEFNRYSEVLSQMINRVGAYTPEAIQAVSNRLSNMAAIEGQITKRSIDTAANVNTGMQQQTIAGGASQVLRLAGYMKDPVLKNLGFQTLSIVDRFTIEELEAGKADMYLTPEQKERLIESKRKQYTGFSAVDTAIKNINPEIILGKRPKGMSDEEYRKQKQYLSTIMAGGIAIGDRGAIEALKDSQSTYQYVRELKRMQDPEYRKKTTIMPTEEQKKDMVQSALDADRTKGMPTGGDTILATQAKMSEVMKSNFDRFGESLKASADTVDKFSKAIEDAILRIEEARKEAGERRTNTGVFTPDFGSMVTPNMTGSPLNLTPRTK
jgi:hypothetical protein